MDHKRKLGPASRFLDERKLFYLSELNLKKRPELNLALLLVAPWFERACDRTFGNTGYRWAKILSPSFFGVARADACIYFSMLFIQYTNIIFHHYYVLYVSSEMDKVRRLGRGWG